MKKTLQIALIIADKHEYVPVEELAMQSGGNYINIFGFSGHNWSIKKNNLTININALLVGIGKVNAANGASYLIASGADIVFNTGLSGGLNNVRKGDLVVGTEFYEHDFDLRIIGYSLGKKPGEDYKSIIDDKIKHLFESLNIKEIKYGTMLCGDSFIASSEKKELLNKNFNAIACDMESAAIERCCSRAGVPFACARMISDDADESATDQYEELNNKDLPNSLNLTMLAINKIFDIDEFWQ